MLTKKKFSELKSYTDQPCVSIYIPTLISGNYDKSRIIWKNAVQEAKQKLEDKDLDASILSEAEKLAENTHFWAYRSSGLAAFFTEGFSSMIDLRNTPSAHVSVHTDFYLNPLLAELDQTDRLFVLAISINEVRFFEARRDGIYPVKISDFVVLSQDEALRNIEEMQSLQHHSVGFGEADYHANGPGDDMDPVRLEQYMRRVDDGLMEMIHDEKVPLVLAAVEEYLPIYQKVTNYNHVTDHIIYGNPEQMSPTDIHQQLEPVFDEMTKNEIDKFHDGYGKKAEEKLVAEDLESIATAAKYKNIDTVLINRTYKDQLSNDEAEKLDDTMMDIYDNGGKILFTDDEEIEIKAVKRFEMELAD